MTLKLKRNLFKKTAGALKGTELDDDELWANVGKKHSRTKKVIFSRT